MSKQLGRPSVWLNNPSKMVDGKQMQSTEYAQWRAMRNRCNSLKIHERQPAYKGCTYQSEWDSYDVWLEWAREQVGFLCVDDRGGRYSLDKDIITKSSHYSSETCVFVPRVINNFILNRKPSNGLPIGVSFNKRRLRYESQASGKWIGYFDTAGQAALAYKTTKESQAKELAEKWYGKVDDRVYQTLVNFTVDIV